MCVYTAGVHSYKSVPIMFSGCERQAGTLVGIPSMHLHSTSTAVQTCATEVHI